MEEICTGGYAWGVFDSYAYQTPRHQPFQQRHQIGVHKFVVVGNAKHQNPVVR